MKKRVKADKKEMFFKIAPILEIVESAIWTGRIHNEKPVSIILIAVQESCKTEALKYFRGTSTLSYIGDLTSRGLVSYRSDIQARKLRHIVLMDLVRIVSHGRGTSDRTMQTLSSLMEEGESDVADAGGQERWAGFPNIGILTSVTPQIFKSKRGRWRATGFLSRFLPVSFSYSPETVHTIHKGIANGYKLPDPRPIKLPEGDPIITIEAPDAAILSRRAEELGKRMKTYGFRYQKTLRRLAMGRALSRGRGTVNHTDIAKVLEWSDFFTDKEVIL